MLIPKFIGALRSPAGPIVAFVLAVALAGCDRAQPQGAGAAPPPPKVTVARPVKRTVVDQDEYVGRFVAVDAIEVRARVSGYLAAIHFKDGQLVQEGRAALHHRPAAVRGRAGAGASQPGAGTGQPRLRRGGPGTRAEPRARQHDHAADFDQRTQAKRVAEASVTAQEAAVRQAALDLEFTELRAPVAGRIGDRRVSPGNLVTGGTTGTTTLLATITSIDPIRFEFTMDETSYLRYVRQAGNIADVASRGANVPGATQADRRAGIRPPGQHGLRRQRHRALLRHDPRPRRVRQSGWHVHARHVRSHPGPAAPPEEALLVPTSPSAPSRCASSCWSSTARTSPGRSTSRSGPVVDGLRVVTAGLDAGDRVIVNGLMRARPGAKVAPQE